MGKTDILVLCFKSACGRIPDGVDKKTAIRTDSVRTSQYLIIQHILKGAVMF